MVSFDSNGSIIKLPFSMEFDKPDNQYHCKNVDNINDCFGQLKFKVGNITIHYEQFRLGQLKLYGPDCSYNNMSLFFKDSVDFTYIGQTVKASHFYQKLNENEYDLYLGVNNRILQISIKDSLSTTILNGE